MTLPQNKEFYDGNSMDAGCHKGIHIKKIYEQIRMKNNEYSARNKTQCCNKTLQIFIQFNISLSIEFKIKIRDREIKSYRVKSSHLPTTELITRYLILQITALQNFHQTSYIEENGSGERCHCATR